MSQSLVPTQFAMKHSDPLLYGKCTCEVCWFERCDDAARKAAATKAAQEHQMELHKRRAELVKAAAETLRQSDFWCVMAFCIVVPTVGAALWAFCNVVYWWLRSRGW